MDDEHGSATGWGATAQGAAAMSRSRRPTLGSVAAMAGVSRQTVSNVINSPNIVAAETTARVRAVISELDYRPHRAARQLRTRRSQVFALRVEPSAAIGVLDRFLHEVTSAATAHDHRIMLYTAGGDDQEIAAIDELVQRWDIDGFLLTGTHPGDRRTAYLSSIGVPFVTFGRPWTDPDVHPWVDVDGRSGTRAATERLIAAGHRQVAFLGWPDGPGTAEDRLSGWREAMQSAALDATLIARSENDITEGRRAAAAVLDAPGGNTPTALVCVSDALALGAIAEIQARGLRPGADVAVIGFDDTDAAQVAGLTSIAQPLPDVARLCVEYLLQLTARPGGQRATGESSPHTLLAPTLITRDTG